MRKQIKYIRGWPCMAELLVGDIMLNQESDRDRESDHWIYYLLFLFLFLAFKLKPRRETSTTFY